MQRDSVTSITVLLYILNSEVASSFYTISCSAFVSLDLCYRQMLYELSENITNEMLKDIIFLLQNCLPKRQITLVCEEGAKYVYRGVAGWGWLIEGKA